MIYATSLPYTVPSPRGKQPGIGSDGRLHALYAEIVGVPSDGMPGLILTYSLTGATLKWRTSNGGVVVPAEGGTTYVQLQSEPGGFFFSGEVVGEPFQGITTGSGAGFMWLPSGSTISVALDTDLGAGTLTVVGCLVEDYGQIAVGDEFTGTQARTELPQLLLREA